MPDTNYIIQGETLTDIADAIRNKKGSNNLIDAADMATEIDSIPTGSSIPTPSIELTDYKLATGIGNGTYLPRKMIFHNTTGVVPFLSASPFLNGSSNNLISGLEEIEFDNLDLNYLQTIIPNNCWHSLINCAFPKEMNDLLANVTSVQSNGFNQVGRYITEDRLYIMKLPSLTNLASNAFQYCGGLKNGL